MAKVFIFCKGDQETTVIFRKKKNRIWLSTIVEALENQGISVFWEDSLDSIDKKIDTEMSADLDDSILVIHLGDIGGEAEVSEKIVEYFEACEKLPSHRLGISTGRPYRLQARSVLLKDRSFFTWIGNWYKFLVLGWEGDQVKSNIFQEIKNASIVSSIALSAKNLVYSATAPFFPLHLSLQAFFAITRDIDGQWVYFGKNDDYTSGMKESGIMKRDNDDISDVDIQSFPKEDAFLLVEEANWDFYANIFDLLMPKELCGGVSEKYKTNCKEESIGYSKESNLERLLIELLQLSKKRTEGYSKLNSLSTNLSKAYYRNRSSENPIFFRLNDGDVFIAEFVHCLRELCAILANTQLQNEDDTTNCQSEKGSFAYKGNGKEFRDEILSDIWKIDVQRLESTRHCKLVRHTSYNRLVTQLKEWGQESNFRNPKIIVQGIEELTSCLDEVFKEVD